MVRHILSNGQEVNSIAGKMIRKEDFPSLYEMISKIQKKGQTEDD